MASGATDDVSHLVLVECGRHKHLGLEQGLAKFYLIRNVFTIHLNMLQARLLLAYFHLENLCVHNTVNHSGVLLPVFDHGQSILGIVMHGVLRESLLLAGLEIVVEAALAPVSQLWRQKKSTDAVLVESRCKQRNPPRCFRDLCPVEL